MGIKYNFTIRVRIPWGPAKKNSTRVIRDRRMFKHKSISSDNYAVWERTARKLFWDAYYDCLWPQIDFLIAHATDHDVYLEIKACPSSNRPDIHNQIDGICDALEEKRRRGVIIEHGILVNDRQIKKTTIELSGIDREGKGFCDVTIKCKI